ncbi:hypothetical protein K3725_10930 [Leisingera sp. S132]|uniref:hypothetical protein n=1 Tax=Leisingera sp. S132 TaxID=2867016 RepID=UPI0021A9759E|nr:hypothetical protein [Leisingera sp. S132]UWQ77835.1 hypothetical protein K3725_10930 [Leisingera sp. S132]
MAKKKFGVCRLTGNEGKLVKSHIIPQAFTRPTVAGSPLLQSTKGRGHLKRWTSWYDASLVTRTGEDLLSEIDDLAIKELRRAKLVWSGWNFHLPKDITLGPMSEDYGIRTVDNFNQEAVCLFFWSIAWRASVSQISDMQNFSLPKEIEEKAKLAILEGRIDCSKMPISLIQLSTKGEPHNHSPILDEKVIPALGDAPERTIPIARIYMDGLIAHLHLEPESFDYKNEHSLFLGEGKNITVTTISYEKSFQYNNLLNIAFESYFGPLSSPNFN